MTDAIVVENLKHTYDGKKYVLDDISFTVKKGEVFGLLGRNGAGKTTTIKILTTLIMPTKGNVNILGYNIRKDGLEIRKRIGLVQQLPSIEFTSVEKNFDIYGILWGLGKKEIKRKTEELLKIFDLEQVRKKNVLDLSGGERRRIQVAREFLHDMDILFLDEPTVGLDVVMRRNLLNYIKKMVNRGLTIVFTTHMLEEAEYLCDRIAVIDKGKIVAMDTVENLKAKYGGKKTVEFIIKGVNQEKIIDKINDSKNLVKMNENKLIILTENPYEVVETIIDEVRKINGRIEWLNIRENTLEDVFLNVIGEENGIS
ncbi:ABC-type multidrug transport system, ATPase component [Caldisphaera lagunensis DSM 15908]|uniref:ABC-type multidrug transport system, ATPase component n=1 Tax=Caldisphaera lagunensis (strain DSM 15908 / JCM 11604 / ANMR 0165 / IC-154) TaxID=1056495 RepID=L0AA94_CALLD|nr:ABC transporter ATP-binding protein [Caldisphaera lagunensis]AFZ70042.1 ABC-type multidrug transport system, ATPase component [Caldisphaera lagunensis DSM 15908]